MCLLWPLISHLTISPHCSAHSPSQHGHQAAPGVCAVLPSPRPSPAMSTGDSPASPRWRSAADTSGPRRRPRPRRRRHPGDGRAAALDELRAAAGGRRPAAGVRRAAHHAVLPPAAGGRHRARGVAQPARHRHQQEPRLPQVHQNRGGEQSVGVVFGSGYSGLT